MVDAMVVGRNAVIVGVELRRRPKTRTLCHTAYFPLAKRDFTSRTELTDMRATAVSRTHIDILKEECVALETQDVCEKPQINIFTLKIIS